MMEKKKQLSYHTGIRILAPLFVLILLISPCPVDSAQPVKVMVLPFDIYATKDLNYLSIQIADVLSKQLKKEGATIIDYPADDPQIISVKTKGHDAIRELARQRGADYILWGSFTQIGEKFSLDSFFVSPSDKKGPKGLNAQGRKLENLPNVLNQLSDQINLKLFHHEIVEKINVVGNKRIESEAILRQAKTKTGSIFKAKQVTEDLKAIFKLGYFDDLRAEAESGTKGKIITFHVKEKPTIRRIRIKGNLRFEDEKIMENLTISTGAILNIFKIRSNIELIKSTYKEKNYHQVAVNYKVLPLKNNQADIEFLIEEGPKLYVTSIRFEGNKTIKSKKLKKQIQTSEKGMFYWLTSSGDLDRTKLDQDAALLKNYYSNQGYINVKVADPIVDVGEKNIGITFKIDEGIRFKVGNIDVSGDLIKPENELLKNLTLQKSKYYSRAKLRNDIIALTDLYGEFGYAHADIKPMVKKDRDSSVVNVIYSIKKNQEVYFENIYITGNTKTLDKVIRRQLKVYEKERFNGAALKRSIRNLYRLDYFEDVKVNSLKGSKDDQMVLKINVTEKPTGMFSFGAGYSDEESMFLVGSISRRNFLGKGQTVKFAGQFGGSTTKYDLSFTEPWLFDIPLSATIFSYNQEKEYSEYTRNSMGGGLGISYPIFDYTRYHLSYSWDSSDVSDVLIEADDTIKELEGTNVTSSIYTAISYDSRDKTFNPTEGSKHKISFEYAGLGGDVGFNKYTLETGWYVSLSKWLIGYVRAKGGIVDQHGDGKILPDYEKFYLGGIHSMRGFGNRGVHLTKINSQNVESKVGGTRMALFNFELIVPISEKLKLMGVVFYDTGNVYDDSFDMGDLRQSAGYGIRWYSPLAPIRIEYGKILDRRDDEEDGRWEFTMGGAF